MRKVKPYEIISRIYSHLMSEIDYGIWADYLNDLIEENLGKPSAILEIAGGNGALANSLSEKTVAEIYLCDMSKKMLSGVNPKFHPVACDMRSLPFGAEFDVVISAFDSVNYLLSEEELVKFFGETASILKPDGIFLFDVSLERNSLNNIGLVNRSGEFEGIRYEQKSRYDKLSGIHSNEFFVEFENRSFYEKHEQRIYPFFDYFVLLEKAGLFASACYEAFTFDDANPDCERAQFVVRKTK